MTPTASIFDMIIAWFGSPMGVAIASLVGIVGGVIGLYEFFFKKRTVPLDRAFSNENTNLPGRNPQDAAVIDSLLTELRSAKDKTVKVADQNAAALLASMGTEEKKVAYSRAVEKNVEIFPDIEPSEFLREFGYTLIEEFPIAAEATIRKSLKLDKNDWFTWYMLGYVLYARGAQDESISCFQRALRADEVSESPDLVGALHNALGLAYLDSDDFDLAKEHFNSAFDVNTRAGRTQAIATNLGNLGVVELAQHKSESAERFFLDALQIDEGFNNTIGIANHRGNLGKLYLELGRYDEALAMLGDSRDLFESAGLIEEYVRQLNAIALVFVKQGRNSNAEHILGQAWKLLQGEEMPKNKANLLLTRGLLNRNLENFDKAVRDFEASRALAAQLGDSKTEGIAIGNLGIVAAINSNYDRATELLERAIQICSSQEDTLSKAHFLGDLANVFERKRNYEVAIRLRYQSIDSYSAAGDQQGLANQVGNVGFALASLGDTGKALEAIQQSNEIFEQIGDLQGQMKNQYAIGRIYMNVGDSDRAKEALEGARALREEQKLPEDPELDDLLLIVNGQESA